MALLRNFISKASASLIRNSSLNLNDHITRTISAGAVSQQLYDNNPQYPAQPSLARNTFGRPMPALEYMTIFQMSKYISRCEAIGKLSSSEALYLLRSCGQLIAFEDKSTRRKLTEDIWGLITKYGVPLDVTHFNSLLQAHIDNDAKIDAEEILQLMKMNGIKPNRITFSKLIYFFCEKGNIEGANGILEIMNEQQHAIDKSVFNSLIIGNSRANDLDGAMQVVEIMKQKGMTFDRTTYDSLLKVYSEMNKFDEIKATVAEAEREGILFSPSGTFEAYTNFLSHRNDAAAAMILPMLLPGQPANVVSPAMTKSILSHNYKEAFELINYAVRPTPHYVRFMALLSRTAPAKVVVEYLQKLEGQPFSDGLLNGIISNSFKVGGFRGAINVLAEMRNKSMTISDATLMAVFNNMDGKSVDFKKNLVDLLQYSAFASSTFFERIFSKIDMSVSLKTLQFLEDRTPKSVFLMIGCFMHVMRNISMEEAVHLVIRNGGFPIFYSWMAKDICNAFCKDLTKIEEFLTLSVILHWHMTGIRPDRAFVFADVIKYLDSSISRLNCEDKCSKMQDILKGMYDQGINITYSNAESLKRECSCLTPEAEEILDNMIEVRVTEKYLTIVQQLKKHRAARLTRQRSPAEVPKIIPEYVKLDLLNRACELNNLSKAEAQYKELHGKIPVSATVKMAKLYHNQHRLNDALKLYDELGQQNVEISLMSQLMYTEDLMLVGRIEDAKNVFIKAKESNQHIRFNLEFLMTIAKLPITEEADALKELLFQDDRQHMKPLVDIILEMNSNNLQSALEMTKNYVGGSNYDIVPLIIEFYKECIKTEQPELMQQMHNIEIEKCGKVYALNSMGQAFLLEGKLKQATHVFQSLGSRVDYHRIATLHRTWFLQNKVADVENVLAVMPDMPSSKRTRVYENAIQLRMQGGDPDQVMEHWTNMQNENLQLSDYVAISMSKFLKEYNIDIPFVVPSERSSRFERINDTQRATGNTPKDRIGDFMKRILDDNNMSDDLKVENLVQLRMQNVTSRRICQHIITNLLNEQNALDILKKMTSEKLTISATAFFAFVDIFEKTGQQEEFFKLAIKTTDFYHFGHFVNYMVKYLQSNPQAVQLVEEELQSTQSDTLKIALCNHYMMGAKEENMQFIDEYLNNSRVHFSSPLIKKYLGEERIGELKEYTLHIKDIAARESQLSFLLARGCQNLVDMGKSEEGLQFLKDFQADLPFSRMTSESQEKIKYIFKNEMLQGIV